MAFSTVCFTSMHTLQNMDFPFYLFDTDFLQYNHPVPCPPTDLINRPDKTELDSGTPDGITNFTSCHSFEQIQYSRNLFAKKKFTKISRSPFK